jgi:poly [ADP-ribose] polymerase 7/11/12/13
MGQNNSTVTTLGPIQDHIARRLISELHRNNGIFYFVPQTWNEFLQQACSDTQVVSFSRACSFLSNYPYVFTYDIKDGGQIIEVRLNIQLGICKKYSQRNGECDDPACQKLHCCSFYLAGDCKRGDSCHCSHDLTTDHNAALLRRHLLDGLPASELNALLAAQIPQICLNYNRNQGCPAGNRCPRLHLCRHFLIDKCKNTRCERSHDVLSEQPTTVLMKCGFNLSLGKDEMIEKLRSELVDVGKHEKQEGTSVSCSGKSKGRMLQICNKYNNESFCQSGDQCQRLHLCQHYALAQCRVPNCGRSHDVMADQPRALLVKYGFNIVDSKDRILAKLREELRGNAGRNHPNTAKDNGPEARSQNVPEVCFEYNKKDGCDKGDSCTRLHLCYRYASSDCTVPSCRGCHDLTADQPLAVLTKFGFDVIEEGTDSVLAQLRKAQALRRSGKQMQQVNNNTETSVAGQTLDTCFFYSKNSCRMGEQCPKLHVCRYFLIDQCKFPQCMRSHDITTAHSKRILAGFGLDVVAQGTNSVCEKLKSMLEATEVKGNAASNATTTRNRQQQLPVRGGEKSKQTITRTPEICKLFNVATGCKKDDCRDLHICRHFLEGNCKFQTKCKRSHNIMSDQSKAVLVSCGFDVAQLSEQQIIDKLRLQLSMNVNQQQKQTNVKENTEHTQSIAATSETSINADDDPKICSFHLFDRCKYKNDCCNYHSPNKLPYQWQWNCFLNDSGDAVNKKWFDFCSKSNADLESRYCDAAENIMKTQDDAIGGEVTINFESMAFSVSGNGKTGEVRRLGTESSASAARRNRYTTVWVWYWMISDNLWQAYPNSVDGSSTSSDAASSIEVTTSNEIELKYLANPTAKWQFQAGGGSKFLIDLKQMSQTNLSTWEICKVRRRPELYRLQEKKAPKESTSVASDVADIVRYPDYWDVNAMKDETVDYVLVPVSNSGSTAAEYKKVADRFAETMPGVVLKSIQRIQNRDLWESFDAFRTRMNRKRSNPANQLTLFHGTRKQYVEAICQQGFDWRMCGASVGTAWGKGSYFARDASYSKSYTDCCMMFLVQVTITR